MLNTKRSFFAWAIAAALMLMLVPLAGQTAIISGTPGNDSLKASGSNDLVNGGEGIDTYVMQMAKEDAKVTTLNGVTRIHSLQSYKRFQRISLFNVEKISFWNGTIDLVTIDANQEVTQPFQLTHGSASNDVFDLYGASATIDGGEGRDVVVVFAESSLFRVQTVGNITQIVNIASDEFEYTYGTFRTEFINVEVLVFVDKEIELDTKDLNFSYQPEGNNSSEYFLAAHHTQITGGKGADAVIFFGNAADYEISTLFGVSLIQASKQTFGNSTLILAAVERAIFADQVVNLDSNDANYIAEGQQGEYYLYRDGTQGDDVFHSRGQNLLRGNNGSDVLLVFAHSENFDLETVGGITHLSASRSSNSRFYSSLDLNITSIEKLIFLDKTVSLPSKPEVIIPLGAYTKSLVDRNESPATNGDDVFASLRGIRGMNTVDGRGGHDKIVLFDPVETVATVAGLTQVKAGRATFLLLNIETIVAPDGETQLATEDIELLVPTREVTGTSANDNILLNNTWHIDGAGGTDRLIVFAERSEFEIVSIAGLTWLEQLTPGGQYRNNNTIIFNIEEITFLSESVQLPTVDTGNVILGHTGLSQTITGTNGRDTIWANTGDDVIFGGDGQDTLVLLAARADIEITTAGNFTKITYGNDEIIASEIEQLALTDGTIILEAADVAATEVIWGRYQGRLEGTVNSDVMHLRRNSSAHGLSGEDTLLVFSTAAANQYDTLAGVTRLRFLQDDYPDNGSFLDNIEFLSFSDRRIKLETATKPVSMYPQRIYIGDAESEIIVAHSDFHETFNGGGGGDEVTIFENLSALNLHNLAGVTSITAPDALTGPYDSLDLLIANVETIHFLDRSITRPNSVVNLVSGTKRNDILEGTDANEVFVGRGAKDNIVGGDGTDSVLIFDFSRNYKVSSILGQTKIESLNPFNSGWEQNVSGVENIYFLDSVVTLATTETKVINVKGYSGENVATSGDDVLNIESVQQGYKFWVDGGEGQDTLILHGKRREFTIETLAGVTKAIKTSNNKTFTLSNIEQIQFDDESVELPKSETINLISATSSTLIGTDKDEILDFQSRARDFDGGAGTDTMVVFGSMDDYLTVTHRNMTWIGRKNDPSSQYSTHRITNVEVIQFEDGLVEIATSSVTLDENAHSDSHKPGTPEDEHVGGSLGYPRTFAGGAGYDTFYIFEPSSSFEYFTRKGVTKIYNRNVQAFDQYRHATITLWQVEELRFADKTIKLEARTKAPIRQSSSRDTIGTDQADIFDLNGGRFAKISGGKGSDTLLVFDRAAKYEVATEAGITTFSRHSDAHDTEPQIGTPLYLEDIEHIQFLDELKQLDTSKRRIFDASANAYLITTSTSKNETSLHIINASSDAQQITASLYNSDGQSLGERNLSLSDELLAPRARLILGATDLEEIFGVAPWKGPAMLDIQGSEHFDVMSKLKSPSGLVSNTNCARVKNANNIEGADSQVMSYVRLINTGFEKISGVKGSLIDADGEIIGEQSQLLAATLTSKQAIWLSRQRLEEIFESTWEGVATLEIENPPTDLKLLNLNLVEDTFFNFSCYQSDNDGTAYLQTTSNSANNSLTHVINTSKTPTAFHGTLYSKTGEQLGTANVLLGSHMVAPGGRIELDSGAIESATGTAPWQGPALLKIQSTVSHEVMTKLKSPSGLVTNTNCVRKYDVHNIEGFENNTETYVRVINIGKAPILNVKGTLYDQHGDAVGTPNVTLIDRIDANEAIWITRNQISNLVDSQWQKEASLVLHSESIESLRLLNLNFVNEETFFNFSCYESGNNPPRIKQPLKNQNYVSGQEVEFYLGSTPFDDKGESLTYTVAGLPEGLTFDGFNKISGTAKELGIYEIRVTASDPYLNTSTISFSLTISVERSTDLWQPGVYFGAENFEGKCANPRQGVNSSTGLLFTDIRGDRTDENNWLRSWSENLYLWYNELPDLNPSLYETPAYFELMKTTERIAFGQPKDQFHFSVNTEEWRNQSREGAAVGYGMTLAQLSLYPPRKAIVVIVEPGSPAERAGIQRGASILEVDGVDFIRGANVSIINAGIFPKNAGEQHSFRILDRLSSTERTVSMNTERVVSTPVQNVKVIDTDTGPLGYFAFNDHIATAEKQLYDAISTLKDAEITDLVVDLRYNSGGYLILASQLAYMISGPDNPETTVFEDLIFNDKHTIVNPVTGDLLEPVPFVSSGVNLSLAPDTVLPTLGLDRVYLITGDDTCSASEALINGLQGIGVEVFQVGRTTCGKPFGFYAQDNCGETYFSIQFRGVNALGFGDYEFGFSPKSTTNPEDPSGLKGCSVFDDYDYDLGDVEERRLATVLKLRSHGDCSGAQRGKLKPGLEPTETRGKPSIRKPAFLQNRILDRSH